MDGASGAYGAVACVQHVKNPIKSARAVLDDGQHCLISGPAAEGFAQDEHKVSNEYFTTNSRRTHWINRKKTQTPFCADLETVGAVALDTYGNLAAAGSTGGLTNKLRGRIGDTSILGAGLWADDSLALTCSGYGDDILRECLAAKVAGLHRNLSLDEAVCTVLKHKSLTKPTSAAVIAINSKGLISIQSTARVFLVGTYTTNQATSAFSMQTSVPLYAEHILFENTSLAVGLTRFPITQGHTILHCKQGLGLVAMEPADFVNAMSIAKDTSAALCSNFGAQRCGLAYDGKDLVSIIPLHGLGEGWEPIIHCEERFDAIFPGYITSLNGPKMSDNSLDHMRRKIVSHTGLFHPLDFHFNGDRSDVNLFARIIRGEIAQWRIWEDQNHVAFLTPFGNTPGFTVLVPRTHLQSDIFGLPAEHYEALVLAAQRVAQHLMAAFNTDHCGMFFEGFEVDYAHIKLVPIHRMKSDQCPEPVSPMLAPHEVYPGYLSTQFGPITSDWTKMSSDALEIRAIMRKAHLVAAPKSWINPGSHVMDALNSQWYSEIFSLQDKIFRATTNFFQHQKKYKNAMVPVTTDSISSPIGLGSDSLPVHIKLHGRDTHLADSMQFTLEYLLRLQGGAPGAFYVSCSFRGEEPDAMHLNQFFHMECEMLGGLDVAIAVAEEYMVALASALLQDHRSSLEAIAGTIDHVEALLSQYQASGHCFPRINLSEALELPRISDCPDAWSFVTPGDPSHGRLLNRAGERALIERFNGPVWLTQMDHLSVPFYQAFVPHTNQGKALCADLLLGPGEILGLGQRHATVGAVEDSLKLHRVPRETYEWYMDIRDPDKGGKELQTSGWGMGVERFLCWILKHDDVRDFAIIPRLKTAKFLP